MRPGVYPVAGEVDEDIVSRRFAVDGGDARADNAQSDRFADGQSAVDEGYSSDRRPCVDHLRARTTSTIGNSCQRR